MPARFLPRAAALGALTAAGQLLLIATLPLYSRFFDPTAYGQFILFVGISTVLSVFAGLRYDSAIVLPLDARTADSLTALVTLIGATLAVLIALVTLGVSSTGRHAPEWWPGTGFGCALALVTLLGAMQRAWGSWCVRLGRFLLLGWAQFSLSLVTVVAQLALVHYLSPLTALVWGYVVAVAAQTACLGTVRGWRGRGDRASWSELWRAAREYRRFPIYMVGYALASTVRERLVQLALAVGAGAAAVGRFGLASRVALAPNSLLYSAVSPIFYGIASRGNAQSVGRFAAGLVEVSFVLLAVPYTALAVEASALTEQLLASKWSGTGPFLQALAAPGFLLAGTCWLDRAFDAFNRQRVALALEAGFTVCVVALVAVLASRVAPVWTVRIYAAAAATYYWVYFFMTFTACGFPLREFRRACANGASAVLLAAATTLLASQLRELPWRLAADVLGLGLVLWFWLTLRGGRDTLRMLTHSRVPADPIPGAAN